MKLTLVSLRVRVSATDNTYYSANNSNNNSLFHKLNTMEVIVIEHETFRRMEEMFIESQRIIREQASTLLQAKIGLLDAKQVADLTGYAEDTIRKKKEDIGYSIPMGKDIKFTVEDVNNWIKRGYRAPRSRFSSFFF